MANETINFEGLTWDEVIRASNDSGTIDLATNNGEVTILVHSAEWHSEESSRFYGSLVSDGRGFTAEIMPDCGVGKLIIA